MTVLFGELQAQLGTADEVVLAGLEKLHEVGCPARYMPYGIGSSKAGCLKGNMGNGLEAFTPCVFYGGSGREAEGFPQDCPHSLPTGLPL